MKEKIRKEKRKTFFQGILFLFFSVFLFLLVTSGIYCGQFMGLLSDIAGVLFIMGIMFLFCVTIKD